MSDLPRDRWPDSTLPLLRDPYRYIMRRARGLGRDGFRARLMGQRAYCLTGPEAARVFHGPGMSRSGAAPKPVREVIFGPEGAVQGLDGVAHRHRKAMLLSMMNEASMADLDRRFVEAVEARLPRWRAMAEVELYEEARAAIAEAVCGWAGVPMEGMDGDARGRQLSAMYHGAGSLGAARRRGLRARAEAQAWIEGVIAAIREGRLDVAPDRPAAIAARHVGPDGAPPPLPVIAADLLSMMRPAVAVSVYGVHLAIALRDHPGHAEAVASDPAFRHAFVQEVRRLAPFFPVLTARTTQDVPFQDTVLRGGRRVVLDIFGTGRDPRSWDDPDAFRPERFLGWPGDAHAMIPQGTGDHARDHRCAGEWATIRLMESLAEILTARLDYAVLTPQARPDMAVLPALPKGGFRIGRVRERAEAA